MLFFVVILLSSLKMEGDVLQKYGFSMYTEQGKVPYYLLCCRQIYVTAGGCRGKQLAGERF